MNTATRSRQAQKTAPPQESFGNLLEKILEVQSHTSTKEQVGGLEAALLSRIPKVEGLLPDWAKGQGQRLVRRALVTYSSKDDLQSCTPQSVVQCVLEAAELGFAIDGRMCHAVPFNNTYEVNGKKTKVREASLIVDYKGLIATAKRCRLIEDGWANVVHERDEFDFYEKDGRFYYHYHPNKSGDPGTVLGAYAVVRHKDGWIRGLYMRVDELAKVQAASACPNSPAYRNWPDEMRKKAPLRRLLKTFQDDPGMAKIFEVDDRAYDLDKLIENTERERQAVSDLKGLTSRLSSTPLGHKGYLGDFPEDQQESESTPAERTGQTEKETTEEEVPAWLSEYMGALDDCATPAAVDYCVRKWDGKLNSREATEKYLMPLADKRQAELAAAKKPKGKQDDGLFKEGK